MLTAQKILGMLYNNRKIDYRNRFSFSCLHYRFLKWVRCTDGSKHGAVACLVIIKWTAVLRCVRWPGRQLGELACPVGLLGGRFDCRLFAGQESMLSPTAVECQHYQRAEDAVMCMSLHPCSLIGLQL